MSLHTVHKPAKRADAGFFPYPSGLLQRKCACGSHASGGSQCEECRQKGEAVHQSQPGAAIPSIVGDVLRSPGQPLDTGVRAFMEPRFGHDFSRVRVHTDANAAYSAKAVDALAYTVGNDVVFGDGQYRPTTPAGRQLIAHELTHTLQQGMEPRNTPPRPIAVDTGSTAEAEAEAASHAVLWTNASLHVRQAVSSQVQTAPRYTQQERQEMIEGRVTGAASDVAIATQFGFQPGDIVFRLGSKPLALVIDNPVTHGGIYLGGGLIHDMVGFGNRTVQAGRFYQEAADPSVVKVIRFTGPLSNRIISRVVDNIQRRVFRLPTDPKPWNLFSSGDDYQTATCLEYAHAQFLFAIKQLSTAPALSEGERATIRSTYFAPGATEPRALAQPQSVRILGDAPGMGVGGLGAPSTAGISAQLQAALLLNVADSLAEDVDPKVFENRPEWNYTIHWPGGWRDWVFGPLYDEVNLRTFTYKSFADSRQFFTVVR